MAAKKSLIFLPTTLNDLAKAEKEEFYQQVDFSTTDGMPFVFYFRLLKMVGGLNFPDIKFEKIERTYGPDLMKAILKEDAQYKHFLCSPTVSVLKNIKKNLKKENPKLKIVGEFVPPFAEVAVFADKIIEEIKSSGAEIIWLGISSPKQVELAVKIKNSGLRVKIFCVGAAFDFLSGTKSQAPRWMQNSGLEWLFRLLTDFRLVKRYLWETPVFFIRKFSQVLKKKD
jgi:N-acetylglucosaminyldiphosphoundecaprenol N-acetyl-beta-D-mannosaminyltransferase